MKTLKERLQSLLDLTSKDETAEELYILLDNFSLCFNPICYSFIAFAVMNTVYKTI